MKKPLFICILLPPYKWSILRPQNKKSLHLDFGRQSFGSNDRSTVWKKWSFWTFSFCSFSTSSFNSYSSFFITNFFSVSLVVPVIFLKNRFGRHQTYRKKNSLLLLKSVINLYLSQRQGILIFFNMEGRSWIIKLKLIQNLKILCPFVYARYEYVKK